jgi:hypothetical protein
MYVAAFVLLDHLSLGFFNAIIDLDIFSLTYARLAYVMPHTLFFVVFSILLSAVALAACSPLLRAAVSLKNSFVLIDIYAAKGLLRYLSATTVSSVCVFTVALLFAAYLLGVMPSWYEFSLALKCGAVSGLLIGVAHLIPRSIFRCTLDEPLCTYVHSALMVLYFGMFFYEGVLANLAA